MNRRDSLKAIGLTSLSAGLLVAACKDGDNSAAETPAVNEAGREAFEVERDKKLLADKFFDEHEMATITILVDIIIPKDDKSGSASEAGVPDFIEFIAKDIPDHQLPLRGGLRWLDVQCLNRYGKSFKESSTAQRIEMVDLIAYPEKAKPEMKQGVAFFNRMRDLTASGFFTSKMGLEDIGYAGNTPTPGLFKGVPDDIIAQYRLGDVKI